MKTHRVKLALGALAMAATFTTALSCSDNSDRSSATSSSQAASQAGGDATEGVLVRYVVTFRDGHSGHWFALRQDGQPARRLSFDVPPSATSGTRIRVWGDTVRGVVRVRDYAELAPPRSPAVTPNLPAKETYAFALIDTGGGVDISAAQAQAFFFSTNPADRSFADFYLESSYGKYAISGDVVGPFKYALTDCNGTGPDTLAKAIEAQIAKKYDHYVFYMGPGPATDACQFSGLAEEGSVTQPSQRTWLAASYDCVVLAQEPGHNFGLMHSNTMTCSGAPFSATASSSCSVSEYGDRLTPMGSGCHQLNTYEKWYEQWLTGCNGVRVMTSGTFNLVPHETSCPGAVQVLQIPMVKTQVISDPEGGNETLRNYYVELRTAQGTFDTGISPSPFVAVYVTDDVPTTDTSNHTYILDMDPSTPKFDGLKPGQAFTDPGSTLSITLTSVSNTGATIQVNVPNGTGTSKCIDGTTLSGSGPTTCASGGSSSGGSGSSGSSGSGSGSGSGSSGSSSGSGSSGGSGSSSGSGSSGSSGSSSGSETSSGSSSGSGGIGVGSSSGSGGASSGSSGSSSGSEAAPPGSFAGSGASSGGCGCDTVGAPQSPRGTWAGLGLVMALGWRARRRKTA